MRGRLEEGQEGAGYQGQPKEDWVLVVQENKQAGAGNWQQEGGQGQGQRGMEGGRPVVGAGTGMELGTLEEQVQEVELSGGEWRDGLLYLWKTWYKERDANHCETLILLHKLFIDHMVP